MNLKFAQAKTKLKKVKAQYMGEYVHKTSNCKNKIISFYGFCIFAS